MREQNRIGKFKSENALFLPTVLLKATQPMQSFNYLTTLFIHAFKCNWQ